MVIRKATVADAHGIAKVHVESWRSTYKGLISDDYLHSLSVEKREQIWNRSLTNNDMMVYVSANESGEIVGFASGGKERTNHHGYAGELYAIYLLDSSQRRGIGKQLISNVAHELAANGMLSMLVWVLAENPSRHFYEALGAKEVTRQQIKIAHQDYEEIAYGWSDIGLFR